MRTPAWVFFPILVAASACQANPPPNWAQGGAVIDVPRARWTRGDRIIDIMPDGRVLGNGDHLFTIDRGGRIYQPDNDPVAVLQPDGRLIGKDDAVLGKIGLRNASPPGKDFAWLAIDERGDVVRFEPDGDPHPDGVWSGCGPAVRSCTLATHIIALIEGRVRHAPMYGPGVGVGIGVGFGLQVAP